MSTETPDQINIGLLQDLLGRDPLPVTQVVGSPPRSSGNLSRTSAKHTHSRGDNADPHTPATYSHSTNTNPHSHDRAGNLSLGYSNSLSYSQADLGETQVDDAMAAYQFIQFDGEEGDTTIMSNGDHEVEIVRSTPEVQGVPSSGVALEDTQVLDPSTRNDITEEPPLVYFSETDRFSSSQIMSSPVKQFTGHNPLSHMSLSTAIRHMPISLTQMFDSASSPLRPMAAASGFAGVPSLPPTPSAAEAIRLMARSFSRPGLGLSAPGLSSPVPASKSMTEEEEEEEEGEEEYLGSPTQIDPVVYVSMQESQEARDRMQKRLGGRRRSAERSVSPVIFNSSFFQKPRKKTQRALDSDAESDDGMISSGEERKRRADKVRKKGEEEVRKMFTTARAGQSYGGFEKSMRRKEREGERARSEETSVKKGEKRTSKKSVYKLKSRQTKSASPPTPSGSETADEEVVEVGKTPRGNSGESAAPTASGEPTTTTEEEDDVSLPMNRPVSTSTTQVKLPVIFTSDAPPLSPSLGEPEHSPTVPAQFTQLQPQDWESLHRVPTTAIRRTRSNTAAQNQESSVVSGRPSQRRYNILPVSTIADSQPSRTAPTLVKQKTSLRSLFPYNIPPPRLETVSKRVPDFVQETSGLVPPPTSSEPMSSLTTVPSDMSSPTGMKIPVQVRGTTTQGLENIISTIPESSPLDRAHGGRPSGQPEVQGDKQESPTRKRKRHPGSTAQGEVIASIGEQELVPCSIEEETASKSRQESGQMSFAAIEGGGGFLSSRPEPDDVDMVDIVADVGAGRDSGLEMVTPRAAGVRKERGGRASTKRVRITPKDKEVAPIEAESQGNSTVVAVVEALVEAELPADKNPEQRKSAPVKISRGKQMPIPKSSRPAGKTGKPGKTKSKTLTRKTRSSTGLRNSIGSMAPNTPTPIGGATDTEEDILTCNNPAFSVTAPPLDATITVPERVFALFRDGKTSYHPATVLESDHYIGTVKVVFDDGTQDVLERIHVRALDLRIGDGVKVDIGGMKKISWEVQGFRVVGEEPVTPGPRGKLTDCRGHKTVSLKARKTTGAPEGDDNVVDVPVTNIYLVKGMWKDFRARVYKDSLGTPQVRIRNATPSESFSTHSAPTTPSKALRNTPMTGSFSNGGRSLGGLFAGMVFALSFGGKESVKKTITSKILQNGGKIVDSGFEELFYDIDRPKIPPTDSFSSDSSRETAISPVQFTPRPETERVGFTAVIADTHSRRAKFLQALALGLPCLAARWVEDCCRKGKVMDWGNYLLPAGESSYLGTVRSRTLERYDTRAARFAGVVTGRQKLLEGRGVIVVVGMGKGVKFCEKRKPYLFLTYALGAPRVAKAATLEGASQILQKSDEGESEEKWDFVYVEAKDKDRAERLWGSGKGKKPKVKVVDDEWVVQSLILGRLIDDE